MFYIRENNRNIRFLGLYAITVVNPDGVVVQSKVSYFDEEFSLVIFVENLLIVITSRVWNTVIMGISFLCHRGRWVAGGSSAILPARPEAEGGF
jgi:hypothetical protein